MKKSTKIILINLILLVAIVATFLGIRQATKKDDSIDIVATNYPAYDFARAVVGDKAHVKMLISPGTDIHNYDPSPQDILDVTNSDVFIYGGGNSDTWLESIISKENNGALVFKMNDYAVNPPDPEHSWTSIYNSINIVSSLGDKLAERYPEYADLFRENTAHYIEKLNDMEAAYVEVIANSPRHTIVVADRFPFENFVTDYGLDYLSPFPGCDEHTEPSSAELAEIINKIKADSTPVIFKIELSDGKFADTISKETGAKVLTLHSGHNISAEDFNAGITYVQLLEQNLSALKEALQ